MWLLTTRIFVNEWNLEWQACPFNILLGFLRTSLFPVARTIPGRCHLIVEAARAFQRRRYQITVTPRARSSFLHCMLMEPRKTLVALMIDIARFAHVPGAPPTRDAANK